MNKQKTSKVALFLLASFVILGSVIMWSLTSDLALAQTGSYPLVTLTAENNSKIIIKTQAVKFEQFS
jgi:hypothetical protein